MTFSHQGRTRPIVERQVLEPKVDWRANHIHDQSTYESLLGGGNASGPFGYVKSGTILGLTASGKFRPMGADVITADAGVTVTITAKGATGFFPGDIAKVINPADGSVRGTAVVQSIAGGVITLDALPAGTTVLDVITNNDADAIGPMVGGDVTTATVRDGAIVAADVQVAVALEGNAQRDKIPNWTQTLEDLLNYGGGSLATGIRFFPLQ